MEIDKKNHYMDEIQSDITQLDEEIRMRSLAGISSPKLIKEKNSLQKEKYFYIDQKKQELISYLDELNQEISMRALAGVSSPKLVKEKDDLERHKLTCENRESQIKQDQLITKEISEEDKFSKEVNEILKDYENKTGKQIRYVKKKHRPSDILSTNQNSEEITSQLKTNIAEQPKEKEKLPEKEAVEQNENKEIPEVIEPKETEAEQEKVQQTDNEQKLVEIKKIIPVAEDVETARVNLEDSRNRYIQAKRKSRSFWTNLFGNINSLFKEHTPDYQMNKTRQDYIEARNHYIALLVLSKTTDNVQTTNQEEALKLHNQKIAITSSGLLMEEEKVFTQKELEAIKGNDLRLTLSKYYRHPWIRMGIGWGLNIGIGLSMVSGLIPLTFTLLAIRFGFGVVGTEGLLHGIQDFFTRTGDRSHDEAINGLPEMIDKAYSLASFNEDRITKAFIKSSRAEETLMLRYYDQLSETIGNNLSRQKFQGNLDDIARGIAEAYKDDDLSNIKNQALVKDRRVRAVRWALAFLGTTAFSAWFIDTHNLGEISGINKPGGILNLQPVPETPSTPELSVPAPEIPTPVPEASPVSPGVAPPCDSGVPATPSPVCPNIPYPPDCGPQFGNPTCPSNPPPVVPSCPEINIYISGNNELQIPSSPIHPGIPPNIPEPPRSNLPTADYSFFDEDLFFRNMVGRNEVSSLKGFAEGQLAIHDFGIEHFNPNDPHDLNLFKEKFNSDFNLNTRKVDSLVSFIKMHSFREAFLSSSPDLVRHFHLSNGLHLPSENIGNLTKIEIPQDVKGFFRGIQTELN